MLMVLVTLMLAIMLAADLFGRLAYTHINHHFLATITAYTLRSLGWFFAIILLSFFFAAIYYFCLVRIWAADRHKQREDVEVRIHFLAKPSGYC